MKSVHFGTAIRTAPFFHGWFHSLQTRFERDTYDLPPTLPREASSWFRHKFKAYLSPLTPIAATDYRARIFDFIPLKRYEFLS